MGLMTAIKQRGKPFRKTRDSIVSGELVPPYHGSRHRYKYDDALVHVSVILYGAVDTFKDGRTLYIFEMTDVNLVNLKAFLQKRLANKEYLNGHSCGGYDHTDIGPCASCDNQERLRENWEAWIERIDTEVRRRAAEAARGAAAAPTP